MEWIDLKQFETLLLEAAGPSIEVIGTSSESCPIYGVTLGHPQASSTAVVVAGMHADEVIGPLAALALIRKLVHHSLSNIRFGIVPIADPDLFHQNAQQLSNATDLREILSLSHVRDLEGNFTLDVYPECIAIRQWIEQFSEIDAYFSLHSAHRIAPGLFFYVEPHSDPAWIDHAATQVATALSDTIPLLTSDPTGVAQRMLTPGFFALPLPEQVIDNSLYSTPNFHAQTSLTFVAQRFQPKVAVASEMPLGICSALANTSLNEIEQYNCDFRNTGYAKYPFYEIPLDLQIEILHSLILSIAEML